MQDVTATVDFETLKLLDFNFTVPIDTFFNVTTNSTFGHITHGTEMSNAYLTFLLVMQNAFHVDLAGSSDEIYLYITIWNVFPRFMTFSCSSRLHTDEINTHYQELVKHQKNIKSPVVSFEPSMQQYYKYCRSREDEIFECPAELSELISMETSLALLSRHGVSSADAASSTKTTYAVPMCDAKIAALFSYRLPIQQSNLFDRLAIQELMQCYLRSNLENIAQVFPDKQPTFDVHAKKFGAPKTENIYEEIAAAAPKEMSKTKKKTREKKRKEFLKGSFLPKVTQGFNVGNPFVNTSYSLFKLIEDRLKEDPVRMCAFFMKQLNEKILALKDKLLVLLPPLEIKYKKQDELNRTLNRERHGQHINHPNRTTDTESVQNAQNAFTKYVNRRIDKWLRTDKRRISPEAQEIIQEIEQLQKKKDAIMKDFLVAPQASAKMPTSILNITRSFTHKPFMRMESNVPLPKFFLRSIYSILNLDGTAHLYDYCRSALYSIFLDDMMKPHLFVVSPPEVGKSYTLKMFASHSVPGLCIMMGARLPSDKADTDSLKNKYTVKMMDEAPREFFDMVKNMKNEDAQRANVVKNGLAESYNTYPVLVMSEKNKTAGGELVNITNNRRTVEITIQRSELWILLSNVMTNPRSAIGTRLCITQDVRIQDPRRVSRIMGCTSLLKQSRKDCLEYEMYVNMIKLMQTVCCNFFLRITCGYFSLQHDVTTEIMDLMIEPVTYEMKIKFKGSTFGARKFDRMLIMTKCKMVERVFSMLFLRPNSMYKFDGVIKNVETNEVATIDDIMYEMRKLMYTTTDDVAYALSSLHVETHSAGERLFLQYFYNLFKVDQYKLNEKHITRNNLSEYTNKVIKGSNAIGYKINEQKTVNPQLTIVYDPNILVAKWTTRDHFIKFISQEIGISESQIEFLIESLKSSPVHVKYIYEGITETDVSGKESKYDIRNTHSANTTQDEHRSFVTEYNDKKGYKIGFQIQGFAELKTLFDVTPLMSFADTIQRSFMSEDNFHNINMYDESNLINFTWKDALKIKDYNTIAGRTLEIKNVIKTFEGDAFPKKTTSIPSLKKIFDSMSSGQNIKIDCDINELSQRVHFDKLGLDKKERARILSYIRSINAS